MESAQQKIAGLLEQLIGLKVSSIGSSTLERVLGIRMKASGIDDLEDYFQKLTVSRLELRKLVEEVVIPETWFFRDQEPFKYLTEYILKSGKDLTRDILRILSLPCSTGEEPYSIAMTMLQAGLAPTSFYIDAVDVSERVLTRARKGVYRENSFRTKDLSFRDNYFTRTAKGFALKKVVLDKVRFLQGNLLQTRFMDTLGRYDVVFCRNVLIYFNEEAQEQVIDSLHHLLVPEGVLFTGHAEAGLFYDARFVPIPHAKAFAFYRHSQGALESRRHRGKAVRSFGGAATAAIPPVRGFARPVATAPPVKRRPTKRSPVVASPVQPAKREDTEFRSVQQLADQGRLDEAARKSEENLRRHGPSAQWFYLLGVIRDSQGQSEEAFKLLRKAVYLDPANIESLIHLSLLAERGGDSERAANYKRRADRLQERG